MGRFLMLQKPVFVRYCVEVWVFPERALVLLVCYTAVFSVVTQRSSPFCGEEHCVTTLKTAV